MRLTLEPHPHSTAPDIAIEAEVERPSADRLDLHFLVTDDLGALRLPPPAPPARADGLWRHSCFEAFVRPAADPGYWEFNFAPSGAWAAYRFSDYRMGMAEADDVPPPRTVARLEDKRLAFSVELHLAREFGLLAKLDWQVGLAAVIETKDGTLSHWALAHPPGAPDFHHRDCFALDLPPPKRR